MLLAYINKKIKNFAVLLISYETKNKKLAATNQTKTQTFSTSRAVPSETRSSNRDFTLLLSGFRNYLQELSPGFFQTEIVQHTFRRLSIKNF